VTLDSKLCFNEVTFGFVPHSGASFYLSRLPGEIGTFLALTGLPITGIDAKEFGVADELVHNSSSFEEEVSDVLLALEMPVPSGYMIANRGMGDGWKGALNERVKNDEYHFFSSEFERARKKKQNIIFEEFEEPRDRKVDTTAATDSKYKKLLYQIDKEASVLPGYFDHEPISYQNYYQYVMGYIKSHTGHEYLRNPRSILLKNTTAINRCFSGSSLEEITESLKREEAAGSAFARTCLQKMELNSQLSMKLALRMLRDARNLDFKGAL